MTTNKINLEESTILQTKGYNQEEYSHDISGWKQIKHEVDNEDLNPERRNTFVIHAKDELYFEKIEFLCKSNPILNWFYKDYFSWH